jgi:metal-sulfur cluster biosynthetic enzyme
MAAAALDNASPTILNTSQLPTRQKKLAPRLGPDSKYADLIFSRPSYLSQPFCDGFDDERVWSSPDSSSSSSAGDDFAADPIDEQEIYDLISTITDPEHPVSLGQLSVINLPDIHIEPSPGLGVPSPNTIVHVAVEITPTITHCSLATVIGLGVRVRLEQALPPNYRVDVTCKENSHSQDDQVNKQLGDKERVAAALENDTLKGVIDKMLEGCV